MTPLKAHLLAMQQEVGKRAEEYARTQALQGGLMFDKTARDHWAGAASMLPAVEALAVALEALQEIASDGWIDGQKTRGPFKGMGEEQIAEQSLSDARRILGVK